MTLNNQEVIIGESKNGEYFICLYNINQEVLNILNNPKIVTISNPLVQEIKKCSLKELNNILEKL